MLKIAVLVSGGGTNLQALIDSEKRGELGAGKISLVLSSKPDVYALQRAEQNGIPAKVLSRKDYASIEEYSKALADTLLAEGIELVVLAGFLTIIDEQMYKAFPNKIINVHPALIPSFCGKGYYGLKVHEAALEKGVKVSGATVHFVSSVVDGGPIILQRTIDISDCKTPEEIQEKILLNIEHKLIVEAVKLYCNGQLKVVNERVEII